MLDTTENSSAPVATNRVSVAVPVPFGHDFDYLSDGTISPGTWVRVPFRNKTLTGLALGASTGSNATRNAKTVESSLDLPPASEEFRRFLDWAARYTLAPLGALLRMAAPPTNAETPPKARKEAEPAERTTPVLSGDQSSAAAELRALVGGGFSVVHLDGVTGSGKTEVFLEAAEAAINRGEQVLILMPEIALTRAVAERISKRLGLPATEWHSSLSPGPRARAWRNVASGKAAVVVGARSALLLPFARLGLIIVDEEHDSSHRQDAMGDRIDRVPYNARDLAVARGKIADIPVVLSSATPSLETWVHVRDGKYRVVRLPKRHGSAGMPTIEIVDLRKTTRVPGSQITGALAEEIETALSAGGQALVFLNRRGYAASIQCTDCGHRIECPRCSAFLVEHKHSSRLQCHHCGHKAQTPTHCAGCNSTRLTRSGTGVERLADEVRHLFPGRRVLTLSSDLVEDPGSASQLLDEFRRHEHDIAVATQIVSKGHNFPDLTLVGVVEADAWASSDDPRANERVFQLLHQVGGRAGRHEKPGKVVLQTFAPDGPVIRALVSGDRDGFLAAEATVRIRKGWAPFVSQASLIVSGTNPHQVAEVCARLDTLAPGGPEVRVDGPVEPRLSRIRDRHRRRFLVTTPRKSRVHGPVRDWIAELGKLPGDVQVVVDIDPHDFS